MRSIGLDMGRTVAPGPGLMSAAEVGFLGREAGSFLSTSLRAKITTES